MKTLLTPTQLIAVEVPEDTKGYEIFDKECFQLAVMFHVKIGIIPYQVPVVIPEGRWEILGTVDKGAIDFDCEPYVEKIDDACIKRFWCYEDNCYDWLTAEESFISLLQKNSLSLDKKYLIIKPKN